MKPTKIHLDIVLYREDDLFVAHCLQLDIIAQATTVEQAKCNIEDLIIAHTEYTIKHDDWDNYFKPAPDIYWALLPEAEQEEEETLQTEIPNMDLAMVYSLNKLQNKALFSD